MRKQIQPEPLDEMERTKLFDEVAGEYISPATSAYTASIGSSVARLSGSRGRQPLPSESLRRTHYTLLAKYNVLYFIAKL